MWNKGHVWNFLSQKEMHNFFESPICMGHERLKGDGAHPTQKPLKVLRHLIQIASEPNALVLDPFMGVGSTGVAALELGRAFLGVEIEQPYFTAGSKRLKETMKLLESTEKRLERVDPQQPQTELPPFLIGEAA